MECTIGGWTVFSFKYVKIVEKGPIMMQCTPRDPVKYSVPILLAMTSPIHPTCLHASGQDTPLYKHFHALVQAIP